MPKLVEVLVFALASALAFGLGLGLAVGVGVGVSVGVAVGVAQVLTTTSSIAHHQSQPAVYLNRILTSAFPTKESRTIESPTKAACAPWVDV